MARTRNPPARSGPRGQSCFGPIASPPLSTTTRADYSSHGCTVFGWPSGGGIIARSDCDIVELKFLGWTPLGAPETRFEDQEKEDAFCDELRMIGGKWCSSRERFLDIILEKYFSVEEEPTVDEWRQLYVGWPNEGGVLILEFEKDGTPWEIGMLRLATTMEERCQLLREKLSATYFNDPMDYPGFATLRLAGVGR